MEKIQGLKILTMRGRGDFVKFYLAPPKMRVAPQMPPQIPRPGAATAGLGVVLMQNGYPIAYASRKLYQAETRYA